MTYEYDVTGYVKNAKGEDIPIKKYRGVFYPSDYVPEHCSASAELYNQLEEDNKVFENERDRKVIFHLSGLHKKQAKK